MVMQKYFTSENTVVVIVGLAIENSRSLGNFVKIGFVGF